MTFKERLRRFRTGKHSVYNRNEIADLFENIEDVMSYGGSYSYQDFMALLGNNGLVVGSYYMLSDYSTAYHLIDGSTGSIVDNGIGNTEPLLVLAISENEISNEVRSLLRPRDVIYYSLDLLNGDDIIYSDGSGTAVNGFKGQIYYRKDTVNNVECYYDFRSIKYRRWAVCADGFQPGTYASFNGQVTGMTTDVTLTADVLGASGNLISLVGDDVSDIDALILAWNTANVGNEVTLTVGDGSQVISSGSLISLSGGYDTVSYLVGDVCKSTVTLDTYYCVNPVSGGDDPSINTADWVKLFDEGDYVSTGIVSFMTGFLRPTYFNIDPADYIDYLTFGVNTSVVSNVSIENIPIDIALDKGTNTSLPNIVLNIENDEYACVNNVFKGCYNMTFYVNKVRDNLFKNVRETVFLDDVANNTISEMRLSIIKGDFGNNSIFGSIGNVHSLITESCYYNTIYDVFASLVLASGFRTNYSNTSTGFGIGMQDLRDGVLLYENFLTSVYDDKTDGIKVSYLDGGVLTVADIDD